MVPPLNFEFVLSEKGFPFLTLQIQDSLENEALRAIPHTI